MSVRHSTRPSSVVRELALPSGGGAIRGMDEAFAASEFSGSATLAVSLPVAPARGLHPSLRLDYDSVNGNGAFGVGFASPIPFVSRRTNRVPRYDDHDELQISGIGPLVEVCGSKTRATLDEIRLRRRPRPGGVDENLTRYASESRTNAPWTIRGCVRRESAQR